MTSSGVLTRDEYRALQGRESLVSRWFEVDQDRIDLFARATDDHQFIHVDPVAAHQSAFGGTIAHGFLSLALLSAMAFDAIPEIEGQTMGVNYGFDRVRLLAPVRSGSRIRGRFVLDGVVDRGPNQMLSRFTTTIEIEDSPKPALVADWLALTYLS